MTESEIRKKIESLIDDFIKTRGYIPKEIIIREDYFQTVIDERIAAHMHYMEIKDAMRYHNAKVLQFGTPFGIVKIKKQRVGLNPFLEIWEVS